MQYCFFDIEKKWREHYEKQKPFAFRNDATKEKFYCLEMFPYPSGRLHMGHVRNYTVGDVLARLKRAQDFNVLHPIGWDAFGLPAENAAIEKKIHPAKWTLENIKVMREQMKLLGFSYDYDREVCTTDPEYYRWGQWIFLKLHEKGLVYRKEAWVNWDPVDKTVLANEQVGEDGVAWRSKAIVEKKKIEQWYIKTTAYADELYDHLDTLKGWGENVKNMQRNWIGKSNGAMIYFSLFPLGHETLSIFTTRPETIYGVTFLAIAFDHDQLDSYLNMDALEKEKLQFFLKECKDLNQKKNYEKKGFFTGSKAINPFSGEEVSLFVVNFVLAEYGTGMVMGCPAHDQRDYAFAKKYKLPIKKVIEPYGKSLQSDAEKKDEAYEGPGKMINSPLINNLDSEKAQEKIIAVMEGEKKGRKSTVYRLKDWLISRQRYWGNPIPVLWQKDEENKKKSYCLVDEKDLPVHLPTDFDFNKSINSLEALPDFICVKDGDQTLYRESDTMDTFTCSSWYFMRFLDVHNTKEIFRKDLSARWLSVDQYIGGIEHACMHLLYARFLHKFLRDIGLAKGDEPFSNLLSQGMVLAKSYFSPKDLRYFSADELNGKKKCPKTGGEIVERVEAMSKSKKNGVDPIDLIKKYGSDVLRLSVLFAAPIEKDMEWSEKTIEGCQRMLNKVFRIADQLKEKSQTFLGESFKEMRLHDVAAADELSLQIIYQEVVLVDKVEMDIDKKLQFNTPVAAMMTFINEIQVLMDKIHNPEQIQTMRKVFHSFLICLNLYCPLLSEEINKNLYGDHFLYNASWPKVDKTLLNKDVSSIVVQINGKMRAEVVVENNLHKDDVVALCKKQDNVAKYLDGRQILRFVYIPQKIVNFVVK